MNARPKVNQESPTAHQGGDMPVTHFTGSEEDKRLLGWGDGSDSKVLAL